MASSTSQNVSRGFESHFNGMLIGKNLTFPERVLLVPCELFAAVENAASVPFLALDVISWELPMVSLERTARILSGRNKNDPLQQAKEALPTTKALFDTFYKVVGFIAGTLLSLTLGLCNSEQNYNIHARFGLLDLSPRREFPFETRLRSVEERVRQLEGIEQRLARLEAKKERKVQVPTEGGEGGSSSNKGSVLKPNAKIKLAALQGTG